MKQFESFVLDTANECLWREGEKIVLPPKPFAVLRYLVDNPGRLITHKELLKALWPDTYVQMPILRTYILDLRRILGDDPAHPQFIQTLPKRGYCFVPTVIENAPHAQSDASASSGTDRDDTHDVELVSQAADLLERALRVLEAHDRSAETILTLRQALVAARMAAADAESLTSS